MPGWALSTLVADDMQAHVVLLQEIADLGRGCAVGEEGIEIAQIAEAHHGAAAELAVVGDEEDLARVRHDALRCPDLAMIEIQQRSVGIDAADADDAEIDLELAEEVD